MPSVQFRHRSILAVSRCDNRRASSIAAGAPLLLEVNVRNLVRPCTWTAPLRGLRLLARRIRGLLGTGHDVGLHAGEQLVVGVCDEVGLAEFEGFAERGLAELAAVQEDERVFAVVVNLSLIHILMVSASESADRVAQHVAFIDAAARAGVGHVVYISFFGAAPDATFTLARDHYATEEHLRAKMCIRDRC